MNLSKKKKHFVSVICCILCFTAVFTSSHYYSLAVDTVVEPVEKDATEEKYKEDLRDLQQQQAEISKKQTELNNKIASAKQQKKELQAKANNIDEQISITEEQIALTEKKISVTKNYILDKLKQIIGKENNIDNQMSLFRERMRAIYMTGSYSDNANSITMLLGADSITDFLNRVEYLKRINEHDTDLVENLREELKDLQEEKAALQEEKAALDQEKLALSESKKELEASLNTAKSSIQDINAMQAEYEENSEELSAIAKKIQNDIADIYKNLNTTNTEYVGGEMMWPVPGYSTISCYYGWRFNHTDFHTGIDITGSGVHGAKVVAANTGTVVKTNYCPYNGYSYGYGTYIIVDHGGGITTLYAHLSKINVDVGDIVVMGEQIGCVGNTGWSTGAHLHFEVRIDGSSTDPISYVT